MHWEYKTIPGNPKLVTKVAYNQYCQPRSKQRIHFIQDQFTERTRGKTIYAVRFDNADESEYKNRLYGFSHGTNKTNLSLIIQSGLITSSYNLRKQQKNQKLHQTGGDKGHDGQYAVYFRFVEKRGGSVGRVESDPLNQNGLATRIIKSLGSVGSSGGVILFLPLFQAENYCFSLAGSSDGLHGCNCFDSGTTIAQARSQFVAGLKAAESGCRGNEIGFYGNINLAHIDIIAIHSQHRVNTIRNYQMIFTCREWKFFKRANSNYLIRQIPEAHQTSSGARERSGSVINNAAYQIIGRNRP